MRLGVEEGQREAKAGGLARLARAGKATHWLSGQRALGRIGHRLVAWGEGLQQYYGPRAAGARPQPASHRAHGSSPAST
jgi:hypothetical protein